MRLEKIRILAVGLMREHGLHDWTFRFDRAYRRLGCCRYAKKEICLSENFAIKGSDEDITDTILHEIAHALVGMGHGHGIVWRRMAEKIGAKPNRCAYVRGLDEDTAKYKATCPNCGAVHHRYKMSRKLMTTRISCGICYPGHFNQNAVLTYYKQN